MSLKTDDDPSSSIENDDIDTNKLLPPKKRFKMEVNDIQEDLGGVKKKTDEEKETVNSSGRNGFIWSIPLKGRGKQVTFTPTARSDLRFLRVLGESFPHN